MYSHSPGLLCTWGICNLCKLPCFPFISHTEFAKKILSFPHATLSPSKKNPLLICNTQQGKWSSVILYIPCSTFSLLKLLCEHYACFPPFECNVWMSNVELQLFPRVPVLPQRLSVSRKYPDTKITCIFIFLVECCHTHPLKLMVPNIFPQRNMSRPRPTGGLFDRHASQLWFVLDGVQSVADSVYKISNASCLQQVCSVSHRIRTVRVAVSPSLFLSFPHHHCKPKKKRGIRTNKTIWHMSPGHLEFQKWHNEFRIPVRQSPNDGHKHRWLQTRQT